MSEVLDRRDKVTFVKGVLPGGAKAEPFRSCGFPEWGKEEEGMITRRFSKFCVGKSGQ